MGKIGAVLQSWLLTGMAVREGAEDKGQRQRPLGTRHSENDAQAVLPDKSECGVPDHARESSLWAAEHGAENEQPS